jgi:hypothetical protein
VSITGVSTPDLLSNTDLTCWTNVDAEAGNYTNYFRVATMGTTATTDVNKGTEWATVSRQHSSGNQPIEMVLGPRATLLDNTDTTGYPADLHIGAYYDAGPGLKRSRGIISGGATVLSGNGYSAAGLGFWTYGSMELSSSIYMGVVDSASDAVRGGFYGLNTDGAAFFVGSYPFATADALLISKLPGAAVHDFQARMNRNGQYETIYVNSAETTKYSACLAVNSNDTVGAIPTSRKPTLYPGAGVVPAFSAFGTTTGCKDTVGLFSSPDTDYTGGSVLRVLAADFVNPNLHSLILAENWSGAAYVPMFRVKGDGNVLCAGAFTGNGADLAEWMLTDAPHDPGSVLVMRNGIAVLSDAYEATGVVGVVSSQPGLVMNGTCEGKENHCRVAKSGMVPVFFSTEFGDVDGNGELLCAGPGGYAVRAPEIPKPGSIVGKAMSAMSSYHGDDVCGVIQMLVC